MLLILIAALLSIKALSYLTVHNDWLWTLQLVVSELGHFLGAFLVLATTVYFFFFKQAKLRVPTLALGYLAALLYFIPLLWGLTLQHFFRRELQKGFGDFPTFGIETGKLLTVDTTEVSWLTRLDYEPDREIYVERAGRPLRILNYHSRRANVAPAWVLVVHGGGWDSGGPAQLAPLNYRIESWGLAAFALEYRLAPQHVWPAPFDDVLSAVEWIQKNAQRLKVDPARGFLIGRSAGGQIALSVCYSKKVRLQGCVAFYSPTDMVLAYEISDPNDFFRPVPRMTALFGGDLASKRARYQEASPISFVDASSPPTLLLHGAPDFWVWSGHSRRLQQKLQSLGVRSAHLEFPWANHGFDVNLNGPAGQLSADAIEWFLKNETVRAAAN